MSRYEPVRKQPGSQESARNKFTDIPGDISGSGRVGPTVPVSVPLDFSRGGFKVGIF